MLDIAKIQILTNQQYSRIYTEPQFRQAVAFPECYSLPDGTIKRVAHINGNQYSLTIDQIAETKAECLRATHNDIYTDTQRGS